MISEAGVMKIKSYKLNTDGLAVEWTNNAQARFSYFWLRDNARDPVSFDSRSYQRELFTAMLPADIRPEHAALAKNGSTIHIKWPDLDDAVSYDGTFLAAYQQPTKTKDVPPPTLWDAGSLSHTAISIDFDHCLADGGTAALLKRLADYGFALVTGCPLTRRSVTDITQKLGYVRETIFGGLWEFEANADMADSAYTPKELRPHTDSTYSIDAPGLQMLLCLEYDATGGESIMVDGFAVAQKLRHDNPALYDALSRIEVTGIYKGDGTILTASRPILRHHKDGTLQQVTFNNYDRETIMLAEPDMTQLYAGIRYLDQLFNDPAYQWRYQLKPGEMLIFDNWRLLHGRGAFHGKRRMAGAYVNREDYLSRLKTEGLVA
jgi:trimethyllysine dioxygenase